MQLQKKTDSYSGKKNRIGIGKKTCFRAETREPFREGKEVVF